MKNEITKIVVVSDHFYPEYLGGAELTTDALFENAPAGVEIIKLRSKDVNYFHVALHKNKLWIITNVQFIDAGVLRNITKCIRYVCVEYDFKFCDGRSLEKYQFFHPQGKEWKGALPDIEKFLQAAQVLFFMSGRQMRTYFKHVKGLDASRCVVLGSIFHKIDLSEIKKLRKYADKSDTWMIPYSDSWVKGSKQAVEHAVKNRLEFEIVEKLSRSEMLEKIASSKGMIYMPAGADTCPRIVIEAKLLGCELILNDNVLHKDESWWNGSIDEIESHIKKGPDIFWAIIKKMTGGK